MTQSNETGSPYGPAEGNDGQAPAEQLSAPVSAQQPAEVQPPVPPVAPPAQPIVPPGAIPPIAQFAPPAPPIPPQAYPPVQQAQYPAPPAQQQYYAPAPGQAPGPVAWGNPNPPQPGAGYVGHTPDGQAVFVRSRPPSAAGLAYAQQHPIYPPYGIARRNPWLIGGAGLVLLIAALLNVVFVGGFPSAAPVEWLMNVGISIVLFLGAVTLGILAGVCGARRASSVGPDKPPAIGGFAITGIALSLLVLFGWLTAGGGAYLAQMAAGERLRYDQGVGVIFVIGMPWIAGIVFGALGWRRGGGLWNNLLSVVAVGLGLLILIPTVNAAFIYSLGLTD